VGGLALKLLLDTHIWLWSLLEPEKLSRSVARALRLERNELWLSPISTWEVLLLAERGRIVLEPSAEEWLSEASHRAPMREAPITHAIARESRRITLAHNDPADRFLAATARLLDLTLVTADGRLLGSREFAVLPNR
jgi:PIN domain nuclease of toxin-antitoxin system